jgi:hypothetical protein
MNFRDSTFFTSKNTFFSYLFAKKTVLCYKKVHNFNF